MVSLNKKSVDNMKEIEQSNEVIIITASVDIKNDEELGVYDIIITAGNRSYKVYPEYGAHLIIEKRGG